MLRPRRDGTRVSGNMTERRRNYLIWLGPPVVFAGALSYFMVFARFPALRDFPWVNLPLVLGGVALSAIGVWRAFARPAIYRGKVLGPIGLLISGGLGALFVAYVFVISTWLPAPTVASMTLDDMPDITLSDQDGRSIGLRDYRGRNVLVVFYRGFW